MEKYKCLDDRTYMYFKAGIDYDYNFKPIGCSYTAGQMIKDNPRNWELIKEEPMCIEKTIKLSLYQAKKMYGKSPEMDELLLANFSKEELTKKNLPRSFNDLSYTPGYYVTSQSRIDKSGEFGTYRNSFTTEKQAKSALAMAQLSQLMAVYNDGWEPDWRVSSQDKYVIYADASKIVSIYIYKNKDTFLAFKTAELRDEFLKNFEPLIKEYFMID